MARRPLLSLSFALNHALNKALSKDDAPSNEPQPRGFHLVNLAIHLAAGLLLLGIVRRTLCLEPFRRRYGRSAVGIGLAVALLWVVHPLNTESVTYIVQRAESLMGMLYLATLYCSLRGFQSGRAVYWYAAAVLACAAGMAVKEVMFTAPLLVFLYDGTFVSRSYRAAWEGRRGFYGALAATWSVFLLLQLIGFDEAVQDFTARDPLAYAMTQPGVILHYLRLSFWPAPLVLEYDWPAARGAAEIVPGACVVGLLLALTGWGLYRRQWYGFLGAWFFLILGPSSSFAALAQHAAEHRMYLSLAAVIALVVLAGDALLRRVLPDSGARRIVAACLLLLAAAALVARTHARNALYHDAVQFWTDNVRHRPLAYVAHSNLGVAYSDLKRFDQEIACYRRALEIEPELTETHNNLGNAYASLRRWDDAIASYRQAIEFDPGYADAHFNLGVAYSETGQWPGAVESFRHAVLYDANRADAHFNLGVAYSNTRQWAEAVECYRRAILLDPDSAATHYSLGVAFSEFWTGRRGDPAIPPGARGQRRLLRGPPRAGPRAGQPGTVHRRRPSLSPGAGIGAQRRRPLQLGRGADGSAARRGGCCAVAVGAANRPQAVARPPGAGHAEAGGGRPQSGSRTPAAGRRTAAGLARRAADVAQGARADAVG